MGFPELAELCSRTVLGRFASVARDAEYRLTVGPGAPVWVSITAHFDESREVTTIDAAGIETVARKPVLSITQTDITFYSTADQPKQGDHVRVTLPAPRGLTEFIVTDPPLVDGAGATARLILREL